MKIGSRRWFVGTIVAAGCRGGALRAGSTKMGLRGGCGHECGGVDVSGYDRGGGVSWWVIGGGVDEDGVEGGCGYKRGGGDSWWVTVRLVPFACSRSPTLVLVHLPSLILVCVLFAKVGEVR